MTLSKVIRDFSSGRYTDPELSVKTSHVIDQMTGNPSFPAPNPPLETLTEANNTYSQSLKK